MRYKKILFLIMFVIATLFCLTTRANAGDLELDSLTYEVQLNSDGSADVKEIWYIDIEDTNTLFKTFEIDNTKYSEITDVTVTDVTSGTRQEFRQINQEMYHVNKGCFYALVNRQNKFEIAWGVQITNQKRRYEITYKIIDAVKTYNDCSEFYWQFISTDSAIPAYVVMGTIKLPTEVTNIEEFRVWAHGPLNGEISKDSNDTAGFIVERLNAGTMLEARIVTPNYVFANNNNTEHVSKLDYILEQEQGWAEEANAKREAALKEQEQREFMYKIIFIVGSLAAVIITIIIIRNIVKYHKLLKQNPKIKPEQELDYYRDIPDETATPAQAGFIYYFRNGELSSNIPKIISATMLDLCMKKFLEFEVVADKKNEIKVILKPEMDKEKLSKDEKVIYELLEKVAKKENSFTMKEFKNYCSNHSTTVLNTFSKIDEKAKKEEEKKENYERVKEEKKGKKVELAKKYGNASAMYMLLMVFSFAITIFIFPFILVAIVSIIATVYTSKLVKRFDRLTQKGVNEKEQWKALKKYMEDFSMIQDKTVPELVLWEKYLVYATVFGIADKVLKQLKVVYPEITDAEYMRNHGYSYMQLMYISGLNNSLINSINTSVNRAYQSSMPSGSISSGTGGGGGFSGGGGFGGGGGRNGRKIICKINAKRISCYYLQQIISPFARRLQIYYFFIP